MDTGLRHIRRSDGTSYAVRSNRDRIFYPQEWISFYNSLKWKQKELSTGIKKVPSRQTMTFDCLISTGARINEIRNLKKEDVDFANRRLILRVTKIKAKKGEKTPRPRTIPLSSQFTKRLEKYFAGKREYETLSLLKTNSANDAMQTALKKAKIKDWYMFSVHNVRKTFETWLIALNIDSLKVSVHVGHDLSTAMQHYVNPDVFSWEEKSQMRQILGDIYTNQ